MMSPTTLFALRFGLGFRVDGSEPETVADVLSSLRAATALPPPVPMEGPEQRLSAMRALHRLRREDKSSEDARRAARRAYNRRLFDLWLDDIHAKIAHAVASPHGFHERLVNFWSGHFAISTSQPGLRRGLIAHFEATVIRPHLGGYFSDMLWHVETHPAMLHYLDQHISSGPGSAYGLQKRKGLNENLAREILELHTLGLDGGYTQADVRQLAELMTGMGLRQGFVDFIYRDHRAEPGAETVLGRSYGGSRESVDHIRSALLDLARHPATARFISWKLARHFVADTPPQALVDRMAQAFTASNGYLPEVYEVMLAAPESAEAFGAKVRQPLDFIIAGLRAVGAKPKMLVPRVKPSNNAMRSNAMDSGMETQMQRKSGNRLTHVPLDRMNQPLWRPAGPDGWPEESEFWITPQGLAERIQWARLVGRQIKADPRELLERSLREAVTSDTLRWVSAAATKAEGIALALSSPEFNRR